MAGDIGSKATYFMGIRANNFLLANIDKTEYYFTYNLTDYSTSNSQRSVADSQGSVAAIDSHNMAYS